MKCGHNKLCTFPRSHFLSSEFEKKTKNDGFERRGDIYGARGDQNIKFPLELANAVHMEEVLQ